MVDHNLTLQDLEEPLGVTRWQWNHAQAGIEAIRSGIKQKKTGGGKMKVDPETVKKFVDYY